MTSRRICGANESMSTPFVLHLADIFSGQFGRACYHNLASENQPYGYNLEIGIGAGATGSGPSQESTEGILCIGSICCFVWLWRGQKSNGIVSGCE